MTLSDLTKDVHAILRSRGETLDYDSRRIGWKVRDLELPRDRNGEGKYITFSRRVRIQIHQLARKFELDLPEFEDCPDCRAVRGVTSFPAKRK